MAGEGTPLRAATAASTTAPAHGDGAPAAPVEMADVVGDPTAWSNDSSGAAGDAVGPRSVRASDADRNAVVERLAKATGEGRITLEEFADAAGAAYAAVTLAELDSLYRSFGLVDALPPPPSSALSGAPLAASGTQAGPVAGTRAATADTAPQPSASTASQTDNVVAIMSGSNRKGRWTVKRNTRAFAFWGSVHLDLRDAVIESDVVEIKACAIMGGVTVTVPEGIPVEMSGCVIMGGRNSRIADVAPLPGAPLVRVVAGGLWGGVDVRSRPSRKTKPRRRSPGASDAVADRAAAAMDFARATTDAALDKAEAAVDRALRNGDTHRDGSYSHADGDHLRRRERNRDRDRSPDRDRDRDRRRDRRDDGPSPVPPSQSGDLLTVVCTDIVGSTRLAVSLGDQRWYSVLSAHNAVVRDLLSRFGGTEVKTSGDGFLLTFTSARAALQFSMALQDAAADERASDPDAPIELRIGVHAGEVERDGTDVIGRNVTIACRLCDAASPGEVLASAVVADLADSASDLTFGPSREQALPGIDRPLVARPAART